jgi:DNA-binding response OmpR family regulator
MRAARATPPSLEPTDVKRILVIDDSPLVIEAVRDALEPDGIAVDEVEDPTSIDRTTLDGYALILLDVNLSATLGDDLAVTIRREFRPSAPLLFLSSLPEAELAARARASGLDGYILKDRGVARLVDEVRTWLGGEHAFPKAS